MGLTFVAAGVSVPDALSSLSVVKEGTVKMLLRYIITFILLNTKLFNEMVF
jgi:Ca2+/Na+ antiporter